MLSLLLSLADSEEQKSFIERLYETYEQDLARMAIRHLNGTEDAGVVVNDVFVTVLLKYDRMQELEREGTLKQYLLATAKYIAIGYRNKTRFQMPLEKPVDDMELPNQDEPIETILETKATISTLKKVIQELSEEEQYLLKCRVQYEEPYADISLAMQTDAGTLRKRMERIRKKLNQAVEREEGGENG